MTRFDWHVRANLKPKHLQLLVALDDFRSLAKVADYLHVTQPAVSKALADLERGLEVELFERSARGVKPSVYGECMVRHARTLLADLSQAREELLTLRSGESGRVALGVLPTAAPVLVPRSVVVLKGRSPLTTVVLREGSLDSLVPDLHIGKLDLIVGTLPPARLASGLATQILYEEDPVVLVAKASHPLTRRRKIEWNDLMDYPWVMPPAGATMRDPLERVLAEHGIPMPTNRVESVSLVANKTILQETMAIGFFSKHIAEHYHELGLIAILPLVIPKLVGPVGVMWIADKPLLPATKRIIDALNEVARFIKP